MCLVPLDVRRGSDPLELELQGVVRCNVVAGNQARALARVASAVNI